MVPTSFNQRWHDYTGLSPQEAHGWRWQVTIHPEDLQRLMGTWWELLASGEPGELEARLRRHDGEYRWFLFRVEPLRNELGKIVRWYGTKQNLCAAVDAQDSEIISTILLMDPDGKRLWPTAGPRVPSAWTERITPLPVGASVGSCGAAAFLKRRVVVPDIANDPLFDGNREVALSNGLRAAWSQPLISKDQEVLGTFAMYYSHPRSPIDSDLKLIEGAGHIALIAIEGERSRTALRKAFEEIKRSEAELRQIVDAIPQTIVVQDPSGAPLYANQAVLDYTGLTIQDVVSSDFRARIFRPEDLERLRDVFSFGRSTLDHGSEYPAIARTKRRDGKWQK